MKMPYVWTECSLLFRLSHSSFSQRSSVFAKPSISVSPSNISVSASGSRRFDLVADAIFSNSMVDRAIVSSPICRCLIDLALTRSLSIFMVQSSSSVSIVDLVRQHSLECYGKYVGHSLATLYGQNISRFIRFVLHIYGREPIEIGTRS